MNWFIIALLSALFSAAAALSQKKVLFKIDALTFSFYVSLAGLLFSFPFFIGLNLEGINQSALLILYFKSILGTFAFLFVMLVLKNFEISKGLPFMVLTPGIVAVFAFIFLNDVLSVNEIIGIILLMLGTYLLELKKINGKLYFISPKEFICEIKTSKKYKYILFALILFTASSILDRLLLTDYKFKPHDFMAFQQLFFAVNFTVIYLIINKKIDFNSIKENKNIFYWIILIGIFTIGYRYTQIEAIKLAPVALVLAVKRISVFFSVIAGGKIFDEKYFVLRAAATVIMVAGTILLIKY